MTAVGQEKRARRIWHQSVNELGHLGVYKRGLEVHAKVAVDKHRLAARVLDVAALDPPLDEPALARAYADPAPVIANFTAMAKRLVARGADVIIPAEGLLAELLVRHGVREIAGAPVMDVFAVTWAYALMEIRLWSRTGLRVGRSWHHRRDDPAIVARLWEEDAR